MIKSLKIFKDQAYIDGKWVSYSQHIEIINPATEEVIASVPDLPKENIHKAIDAAYLSLPSLKSPYFRREILYKWYKLILEHQDELATIVTLENGKTYNESKKELIYAANFVIWFAEEALRIQGATLVSNNVNSRLSYTREPIGVVGAITPWNFPLAMVTRKVAPAIAAGCSVVLKPSEFTPLSALSLCHLAIEAGFPKGVFNVVTGQAGMIGDIFANRDEVRKITFTGSTRVGKILYQKSADKIKKISLELGGNAPLIIFADADLELAVQGIINSKLRSTGQACTAVNRIFVHESLYEKVIEKCKEAFEIIKVGEGLNRENDLGAVINEAAITKYESLIKDALNKGAKLITGGNRLGKKGYFYSPTIIKDASFDMEIFNEEIFGPIAVFYKFTCEEEAVKLANKSNYGLAAYFYTQNLSRAYKVQEALQFGMIGINETIISNEIIPFGGIKESGIGLEGSHLGINEFLQTKAINIRI